MCNFYFIIKSCSSFGYFLKFLFKENLLGNLFRHIRISLNVAIFLISILFCPSPTDTFTCIHFYISVFFNLSLKTMYSMSISVLISQSADRTPTIAKGNNQTLSNFLFTIFCSLNYDTHYIRLHLS